MPKCRVHESKWVFPKDRKAKYKSVFIDVWYKIIQFCMVEGRSVTWREAIKNNVAADHYQTKGSIQIDANLFPHLGLSIAYVQRQVRKKHINFSLMKNFEVLALLFLETSLWTTSENVVWKPHILYFPTSGIFRLVCVWNHRKYIFLIIFSQKMLLAEKTRPSILGESQIYLDYD